jgi:RNA-binding protein 25
MVEESDRQSSAYEKQQAKNVRLESEQFPARQRSLQEEQKKAGMVLDDGAPVKLSNSLNLAPVAG